MKGKRWLWLLVAGFALFFIFTQPVEAATMLRSGLEGASRLGSAAFQAFSTFLNTLL